MRLLRALIRILCVLALVIASGAQGPSLAGPGAQSAVAHSHRAIMASVHETPCPAHTRTHHGKAFAVDCLAWCCLPAALTPPTQTGVFTALGVRVARHTFFEPSFHGRTTAPEPGIPKIGV